MYLIIYSKENKNVLARISGSQNFEDYSRDFNSEFIKSLCSLYVDDTPDNYKEYKVINSQLVKMTNDEIEELRRYYRILTDAERLLEQLKPSQEEIQKAKNTIELLTLLQEVM